MSFKISQLPAATAANPSDAFEKSDQGGAPSQQVTLTQIQGAVVVLNTTTPTAGTSYTIDLSKPDQTISTAAAIDFTASSNRPLAGFTRSAVVRIEANAAPRALTFNANWVTLGAGSPSTLAANKVGILSLKAYGPNETDVLGSWSSQP